MVSELLVSLQVYNFNKLDNLLNREGFSSKRLTSLKRILSGVSVEVKEESLQWEMPDGTLSILTESSNGITIIVDFSYPFFDNTLLTEAVSKFKKYGASYLATHNPRGEAVSALLISKGFGSATRAKHECYPFMITEKEAFRFDSPDDWDVYRQLLNHGESVYSCKEQLESAIKYKDNLGDYYGKDVSHDPVLARSARDAPQRIETLLKIPTGKKCLDVGCSCGIITAQLAESGKEIVGVEIVPQLYQEAEELKKTLPIEVRKNLTFINSPIEKCEFGPDHFDTIYMTETFEHIPHFIHHELFEKIIKYLKPAGSVIFSVPNRYPAQRYVDEGRHRWDWFNHVTHYTANSVESFLRNFFKKVQFHPVYDEPVNEGIFLICEATGKK